jgi:hypothetical protein
MPERRPSEGYRWSSTVYCDLLYWMMRTLSQGKATTQGSEQGDERVSDRHGQMSLNVGGLAQVQGKDQDGEEMNVVVRSTRWNSLGNTETTRSFSRLASAEEGQA